MTAADRTTDVLVIGAGLSGLVAAAEAADAGRRVVIVDQEPAASLGGQAYWSFGGLFLVGSAEQRRLGIKDTAELALDDWLGSAAFDRPEDYWPEQWARAYVDFAAGEKRSWLRRQGIGFFPVVQWAERGGYLAGGHGNSVPRFHLVWGTGPGVLTPFLRRVMEHVHAGRVRLLFRHRVTALVTEGRRVVGVRGEVLSPSTAARGKPSNRNVDDDFEITAGAVVVCSGGIGANHDLVRKYWPSQFGGPPKQLLSGVPDSTDGLMLGVTETAGGRLINSDRMWHYPEGIANHSPVWTRHGIRILSGPSPLWLDAHGHRLPIPLFPGFDSLGALRHITASGHPHSWFLLDEQTLGPEFGLSGSEQNPDLTGRSVRRLLSERAGGKITPALQAFLAHGTDFLTAATVPELTTKMNQLTGSNLIDAGELERTIRVRDAQVGSGMGKDAQVIATEHARRYFGDRQMRTVAPHRMLNPGNTLVAVRLHVLTRKTLGGLETDLSSRVLGRDGLGPLPGLFSAGEAAGFGGGGVHGYRALEGTFLGGCLFSGRTAGRVAALLD